MSLIKRITMLATLGAIMAAGSGCDPEYGLTFFLQKISICAHGTNQEASEIGCAPANTGDPLPPYDPPPIYEADPDPGPPPPPLPPEPSEPSRLGFGTRAPSTAAAGRPGKAFRARLTAKSVTGPDFFKRADGAGATNIVARGRFSGSLVGDSRARRRFSSGRWISRGELSYETSSRKFTGDAYLLLRFRRRGAGSLCLSVRINAAATKRGKARTRGSFVALGGTGGAAKIVGSGSFSQLNVRGSGSLRGRARLRTGATRPLPALCASLVQTR